MRVRHPDAGRGESVNVDGTSVPVEDGTFDLPPGASGWLDRWCNANGYNRSDVVLSGSSSNATADTSEDADAEEATSEGYDVDLSSRADLEAQSHDALKATAEQLGITADVDLRSKATIIDGILDYVTET